MRISTIKTPGRPHYHGLTREFDLEFETVPHNERLLWAALLSLLSHSFCLVFGALLSQFVLTEGFYWWWLEVNYLLGCVGGYFIHWLGHRKEAGRWFHAHTSEHHIKLYPPQRFLNEKSLVSRDPNAKFYYPLLASIFLVSYFVLGGAFFALICFIHIGFALLVCDYLHEGFHAKGFWLENYRWFIALRELHYLHHKGHMTGKQSN